MELICTVITNVTIDLNLLEVSGPFTNETVLKGQPKIRRETGSTDFNLILFDKICGKLEIKFSSILNKLVALGIGQRKVTVKADDCLVNCIGVILEVLAPPENAINIILAVVQVYGANVHQNVAIPFKILKIPGIQSLVESNYKRTLQMSSNEESSSLSSTAKIGRLSNLSGVYQPTEVQNSLFKGINGSELQVKDKTTNKVHELIFNKTTLSQKHLTERKKSRNNLNLNSSFFHTNDSSQVGTGVSNLQASTNVITNLSNSVIGIVSGIPNNIQLISSLPNPVVTTTYITLSSTKPLIMSTQNVHSPSTNTMSTITTFSNSSSKSVSNMASAIKKSVSNTSPSSIHLDKIDSSSKKMHSELENSPSSSQSSASSSDVVVISKSPTGIISQSALSLLLDASSLHRPINFNPSTNLTDITNINIKKEKSEQCKAKKGSLITKNNKSMNVSVFAGYNPNLSLDKTIVQSTSPYIRSSTASQSTIDNSPSDMQAFLQKVFQKTVENENEQLRTASVNVTSIYSNVTIEGEPTNLADLPTTILDMLKVFNEDHSGNTGIERSLVDERSRGVVSSFLLGQVNLPSSNDAVDRLDPSPTDVGSNNADEPNHNNDLSIWNTGSDSDDNVNASTGMLIRRRKRRNPIACIGANANKLYEGPTDVDYRNLSHSPSGEDSANFLLTKTLPPRVKKNKLDELFDMMSELPKDREMEPCSAIRRPLLPHQKTALQWMVERENTSELPPFWQCVTIGRDYVNVATRQRVYDKPMTVNGGILADDMGLGKTLTTISLILTNHANGQPMFSQKNELPRAACDIRESDYLSISKTSKSILNIKSKKDGYIKPRTTKKSEVEKPGFKFRQLYLHQLGKEKKTRKKKKVQTDTEKDSMFSDSDEDDTKDISKVNKHVREIINSTTVLPNRTPSGESGSSRADDRKATLIVCPMSVLSNWTIQFQQHVDPKIDLQIYVFYGPERVRDVSYLKKYDVIITTYGTLTFDFKSYKTKGKPSPMHQINWLRVVLDEGHIIRNARSQQTNAIMGLNASRRWLLTGTPIQNRMTDLWSMIKFLRLEPFTNRKWWFRYVVDSMKRKPKTGEMIFNRVAKIVHHLAIRRLKTDTVDGKPLVVLPKRTVIINKIHLSEEERKVYDAMQKDGKLIVCKYFRTNTVMKNYANVLAIIMRLRQLCCHPKLCAKAVNRLQHAMTLMDQFRQTLDNTTTNEKEIADDNNLMEINNEEREKLIQQLMNLLSSGDSEECSICLENLKQPVITRCAHVFCSNCINEVIESSAIQATCPLCRAEVDSSTMLKVPELVNSEMDDDNNVGNCGVAKDIGSGEDDDEWRSSAKIDFLMKALEAQRDKEPAMKSLIVSQFTSFLDVLHKPLKKAGFNFTRLDGTMSQSARARVIDELNSADDYSPTIMLLSLTAGGVGLNLIGASRVFLLDPAWNPAIEEQCFDRCHRLGQTKDVIIIKLIIEDSVEDRMLILQQQKRELMQKAFGMNVSSPEERSAAALRDISTLLGLNFRGAEQSTL